MDLVKLRKFETLGPFEIKPQLYAEELFKDRLAQSYNEQSLYTD